MYKMKQVCQLSGLTEKSVRFYIDQELVTPKVTPGLHYKAYHFDDADVGRLMDISALRSADFSIADIRRMLDDPNCIPATIAEKEQALRVKIASLQSAQRVLGSLTVQERSDLEQTADAILPRSTRRRETPPYTRSRLFWLGVYVAVFLLLGIVFTGGRLLWISGAALLLLAGVQFPVMAMGYFRYNRRFRKMECSGHGTIISIVTDDGVADDWDSSSLSTFFGVFHTGFFHWNWVRPDHWVPLIQFQANGETVTAPYRYGGLKNSWHVGDRAAIAWEQGREKQIYPQQDRVIRRKAWAYLLLGIAALALFLLSVKTRSVLWEAAG